MAIYEISIESLFAVGAATLFLRFIDIYNSWDTVTYNVFVVPSTTADVTDANELSTERDEVDKGCI